MRIRRLPLTLCLLILPFAVWGQEAAVCRDFHFSTGIDPYLSLSNPAAISAFNGHISMAKVDFRKDNGGLHSLTESHDSYKAGASTESYISVSDRISFHGRLNWSYFSGRNMGAQVLMDPDYNPVNFLESDEATVGRKNREDYSLLGAMSYKLGDKWALGAEVDYTSADQTKIKDPRFSNVWMDLSLKAGFSFMPGDKQLLGAALVYRNTMETVRGGIYGTTDKQYFIYNDKGGFFGTMSELAGDLNYVPGTSENRPMKNDFFGLSLQAMSGAWSNDLEVLYRQGYYGKKSSSSATYFEFSGLRAAYKAAFQTRSGADIHKASLKLDYEFLDNAENLFMYDAKPGYNIEIVYFGQNDISVRHMASAALSYVFHKEADGYLPAFSAGATLSGRSRFQATVLYPYYRNTDLISLGAELFADRNIISGKSVFSIGGTLGFRYGFGTPKDDGTYASTSGTALKSFDNYLFRQFEYDTAPGASAGLSFTYTRMISDKVAPYVRLSDTFTMLFTEPQYLSDRIRNVALLSLGVSF